MAYTAEEIFTGLQQIGADLLGIEPEEITRESNLVADFDADSLDLVEMLLNVKKSFQVEVPKDELPNLLSVGDVADYVTNHQS